MMEELLVPLKQYGQVHEVIPYVEKISQPGMKVVFFLPFTAVHLNGCRDRRIPWEADMHTRLLAGLPSRDLRHYRKALELQSPTYGHSWEDEKRTYEEKLFPRCEGLRQKGSEVAVTLYNRGDLRGPRELPAERRSPLDPDAFRCRPPIENTPLRAFNFPALEGAYVCAGPSTIQGPRLV